MGFGGIWRDLAGSRTAFTGTPHRPVFTVKAVSITVDRQPASRPFGAVSPAPRQRSRARRCPARSLPHEPDDFGVPIELPGVKRLSILTPDRRAKLTPLSGNRAAGTAGGGSGAVLEAPALVAGLDDLAMMGETVEQGCGHLGVAEDGWPFAEGEVGGDDDRGCARRAGS